MDWSTAGVPAQPTASKVQQHTASSRECPVTVGAIEEAAARGYRDGGGGWLARHSTIEKMGRPHRFAVEVVDLVVVVESERGHRKDRPKRAVG